MIDWIAEHPGLTWLAVAVALTLTELLSLDFVLLMLAIGALAASVVSGLGAPMWVAVSTFVVASAVLIIVARPPLVARLHSGPTLPTSFENLIGQPALVLSPVDSRDGRVRIGAEEWSARTEGPRIDAGAETRVVRIEGATAVVALPNRSGESA